MLTQFFLTINDWITGATYLAALGCFLWGMVSVLLSPCHLASIPLVVAYVAGQEQALKPRQAAHYAIFFTVGLFITIAVIGVVCALLGRMLGVRRLTESEAWIGSGGWFRKSAGIVIGVLGIYFIGSPFFIG